MQIIFCAAYPVLVLNFQREYLYSRPLYYIATTWTSKNSIR